MPRQFTPRPAIYVIGPSIAYIPLSRGQFTCVDRGDANWLSTWSWYAEWNKNCRSFYPIRNTYDSGKRTKIRMQAQILGTKGRMVTGDHLNHNGLDNRRANLLKATAKQQRANQRRQTDLSERAKKQLRVGGKWACANIQVINQVAAPTA